MALPQSDGLTDRTSAVHRALAAINQAYNARLEVKSTLPGQEGGAYFLEDPEGRVAVLKWHPDPGRLAHLQRVSKAVEAVRAEGYPTAAWLVLGATDEGVYQLTSYLPGAPAPLTLHTATQLVGVLERQAGLNPIPERNWSEYVLNIVLDDPPYGPKRVLSALGQPGELLIDHYRWLCGQLGPVGLPANDLVHGDFNTCNTLFQNRRLRGVVDVEAMGSGSRVIDYACLLREAFVSGDGQADNRATLDMIRTAAEAVAGRSALAVCVAATAFDVAAMSQRYEPEAALGLFDRLHQLADYLARPL